MFFLHRYLLIKRAPSEKKLLEKILKKEKRMCKREKVVFVSRKKKHNILQEKS
jgi:hypothetical protein